MKRSVILIALVAAAVVGSKLLVENVAGVSLESTAASWLADPGAGSAVLIVALLALDVFMPIPSSLVMVLSGAAFGVTAGAALALVGSIGGEWLGFEIVRRYGRRVSARMIGDEEEIQRFRRFFDRHGMAAIIVTRPLPVVMETMSLVAGLAGMARMPFLVASLIGTAPVVLVYSYAGAFSREVGSLVPAIVILVAFAGAGLLWKMGSGVIFRGQSPR